MLAPFQDSIADWLKRHNAGAVLVRPDRYVFGTGEPHDLRQQFARGCTTGRQQ
jgi:3-(3-hydroxy-phenyl)propionate hydroxylase